MKAELANLIACERATNSVGTDMAWSNFANVEWFTVERSKNPDSVGSGEKRALRSMVSVATSLSAERFPPEFLLLLSRNEGRSSWLIFVSSTALERPLTLAANRRLFPHDPQDALFTSVGCRTSPADSVKADLNDNFLTTNHLGLNAIRLVQIHE
jgi:hypothetical protein